MTDRKRVYDTLRKYVDLSVSADSRTTAIPLDLAGDILDLLKEPEPSLIERDELKEYIGKVVWFEFKDIPNPSPAEITGITDDIMYLNMLPNGSYLKNLKPGDVRVWTAKPSMKLCCEMEWE